MSNWVLPEIDLERCDQCGLCVEHCPTDAVEMGPDGPSIVRPRDCTYCTDCEAMCPEGAIACPFEIVWVGE
ncbi:MAG: 4Fe-4S binding protein [Chloroflexota bacterium]|nr:4Fe-4S binding protein [Chloroflexota bacterium]